MNSSDLIQSLGKHLPEKARNNLYLKLFGFFQVPMIHWTGARVVELSHERCEVMIPLKRRNRNHLKSMYFGVLAVGADVAGGLMAMNQIQLSGKKISLVFKDFKANFLKRPEADTYFSCEDGGIVRELIAETLRSGERVHRTVKVTARTPEKLGDEPVAEFELTISLKAR